ncbi:MAG: alpha/beta fold hydrolase [Rhodothermaceae bacterium]|nr:alpha/beta fold hydrolase [Rhodothermaceae bacterium]
MWTHTRRLVLLFVAGWGLTACAQEEPSAPLVAEGVAEAEGVALYYRLFGNRTPDDAVPLLVLNGGPGLSSEHFGGLARQLSQLGRGRTTITFDQRGTGRSRLARVDASTVTLAAMVQDIEALRAHLGVHEWIVFGHSWGGMYAMAYAVAHPERVRGLVLSASGGSDLEWTSHFQNNLRHRLGPERRTAYDRATTRRERVEAMAAAYVFNPEHIPFVVESLSRPGASNPTVRSLVFQNLFQLEFDLRDDLARLERPVLILHGRQDVLGTLVPYKTHQALPNSDLVFLDACGHYLWLDQPEAYFEAIGDFLREEVR